MTRPAFYFSDPVSELSQAQPGEVLRLGGEEGRHAATVRRIREGEGLDLVDGYGTRALCEVVSADKQGLDCRLLSLEQEAAPLVRLILVQALAKGGRDEQAIEICTEIGIDGVIPWQSDRTIVRWTGPKAKKGRAKWENTVRAAAKQARRAWLPLVEDVVDSRGLLNGIETLICQGGRALICHEEAIETLSEHLRTHPLAECEPGSKIWIIVGPEGGISPEETSAFQQAGAELIGLGRNVLRSSTAGAVCATLLSAALNRL